jgi:hypothetical protein
MTLTRGHELKGMHTREKNLTMIYCRRRGLASNTTKNGVLRKRKNNNREVEQIQ